LKIKQLKLQQEINKYQKEKKEFENLIQELEQTKKNLAESHYTYDINAFETKLIALNKKLESAKKPTYEENLILNQEIKDIETKIKKGITIQTFSGYISFPTIPKSLTKK
jgi:hypothetical protein